MPTFGAVTLDVLTEQRDGLPVVKAPFGTFEPGVVETPLLGGGADLQMVGRGAAHWSIPVEVASDADMLTLLSYVGDMVPRDFLDPWAIGVDLLSVYLVGVDDADRVSFTPEHRCTLKLTQVGP